MWMLFFLQLSVVVDKGGKVIYFDAHCARPGQQLTGNLLYTGDSHANILVDKIIADSPLWKPALNEGKTVNSYVSIRFPGC
jgi:hypothetical protein